MFVGQIRWIGPMRLRNELVIVSSTYNFKKQFVDVDIERANEGGSSTTGELLHWWAFEDEAYTTPYANSTS